MNQNFYNFNSFGFDQIQPPQHFDNHQPQEIPEVIPFIESKEWIESKNELYKMMEAYTEIMNQQREQEALLAAQREQELLAQKQAAQEKEEPPQNSDFHQIIKEICGTKVGEEQKQNMEDTMLELLKYCRQKEIYCAHNNVEDLIESALNSKLLSIKSKSQRLVQETQEVKNIAEPTAKRRTHITSCLQNFKVINKESIIPLNNTPQISPVNAITHDLPSECDLPVNYEFSLTFTTFSNPLFDSNNDFSSSDDESLSNEDFDYLLEEFSGEFAHIDLIPLKIVDTDFKPEEEIRLVENLSYDNSCPRPPEELNAEIANTIIESLSPPPIPIEDSDSLMEEIDSFLASDNSMPPGIKNDDYESEGDIRFLEELLSNDSLPLIENESSNIDHVNDPSSPRPPPKPPDDDIFETKPNTGVLTAKVVGDISKHDVLMHNLLPTQPTLCPVFDPLLLFSSENEDKVFKPGILTSILLSHRDKITFDFSKSPMMMYGGEIPHLDVLFFYFYPP
ncbi:hypothetical protein Tco_0090703 [Tanacetum coccineum]